LSYVAINTLYDYDSQRRSLNVADERRAILNRSELRDAASATFSDNHYGAITTDLYKYSPDAVPPIQYVSSHVATDKDLSK